MALTADQITAKNFKEFYDKIFPYLNGGLARNNYSTDEQVVGTWIDGKPLYQITIPITAGVCTTAGTVSTVTTTIDSTFNVIDIFGVITSNSDVSNINGYIGFTAETSAIKTIYSWVGIAGNTKTLYLRHDRPEFSEGQCYITLQYTKTTD